MKNLTARSSHQRSSVRKTILRKSLFFNKVAGLANNFIKTKALAQVFSCEFCEISKNNTFYRHLRTTASEKQKGGISYYLSYNNLEKLITFLI